MELILSDRDLDKIVHRLRIALRADLKKMLEETAPDMVTTNEAAAILGITAGRLRQIVSETPNRYPHIKRGEGKQGRLMFKREGLLN